MILKMCLVYKKANKNFIKEAYSDLNLFETLNFKTLMVTIPQAPMNYITKTVYIRTGPQPIYF